MKVEEKFRIDLSEPVIDMYKLPPLMVVTSGPIYWMLAQATSKKQRKYYAAQIILGQPFNKKAPPKQGFNLTSRGGHR